ncbi:MAG: transposase [Acidimicrobiales bacterium]
MDGRELRALAIAATTTLHRNSAGWIVPSQSGVGTYTVSNDALPTCTCPDYELRQQACKRVLAVQYTIRRQRNEGGVTVTEEVKVTYTQDRTTYNRAQCDEKARFLPILADLCSTVTNPPQGRGRPRLPLGDMAFQAVHRVYGGMSARRFDTDVREAKAAGFTDDDPHFNSVLTYLRKPELTGVLRNLIALSALPLTAVEKRFAIDSTGFSTCKFARWYDDKYGREAQRREWIKLHAMTGVLTNIVTAVEVTGWTVNDSVMSRPLVEASAAAFSIEEVSADKAYLSHDNFATVAVLGGTAYVPFKSNTVEVKDDSEWSRMYHLFAYDRDRFLAHYHRRSNVESTFSMIKRKFGDSLRSRSDQGQINEVLAKVVAHNLCVLNHAIHDLQIPQPRFVIAS